MNDSSLESFSGFGYFPGLFDGTFNSFQASLSDLVWQILHSLDSLLQLLHDTFNVSLFALAAGCWEPGDIFWLDLGVNIEFDTSKIGGVLFL